MIGRTLAHYRITAAIGAGGMGEVYRARDTRLERDVALKVLPAELASDPRRSPASSARPRPSRRSNHPEHRHDLLGRGGRRHPLPHDGAGRGAAARG